MEKKEDDEFRSATKSVQRDYEEFNGYKLIEREFALDAKFIHGASNKKIKQS